MPDPLQVLPNELWSLCLKMAVDGQQAGPLEFILVSPLWERLLLDSPSLWTQIYVQNGEDEMARISALLYFSKNSPLHVDIITVLPTLDSLQLIAKHMPRVTNILIRPGPSDVITALHTEQWKQAASRVMGGLSHCLMPSDTTYSSCSGISHWENGQLHYRVILIHFTIPARKAGSESEIHALPAGDIQASVRVWEKHVASIIHLSVTQDSCARTDSIYSITTLAACVLLQDAVINAIPSLFTLLKDDDHSIRLATIDVLFKLTIHNEFYQAIRVAIPSLVNLHEDGHWKVRSDVAKVIGKLSYHAGFRQTIGAGIPSLIKLLEDVHWKPRVDTIKTIKTLADHAELRQAVGAVIPSLIRLLEDKYWFVRLDTVKAIIKVADHTEFRQEIRAVNPSLSKLLEDEDVDVRLGTVKAIAKFAEHAELRQLIKTAISPLIRLLADSHRSVRLKTLKALTRLSEHAELHGAIGAAIPSLIQLLEDGHPDIRLSTLSAIDRLNRRAELLNERMPTF